MKLDPENRPVMQNATVQAENRRPPTKNEAARSSAGRDARRRLARTRKAV